MPNARVVRGRAKLQESVRGENRCAGANALAILQCPNAPSGAPQPPAPSASTDKALRNRASIWFGRPCALAATNVERTRGKCGLGGPARTRAHLPRASAPQSYACCSPISACSLRSKSACIDLEGPLPHSPTRSQPLMPWSAEERVKSLHAPIQGRLPTSVWR